MYRTEYISRKAAQNIFRAFDFSKALNIPLNTSVTINLSETDAKSAATIVKGIGQRYRRWMRYRYKLEPCEERKPRWAQVFENPANDNPHVHWILHIPEDLYADFQRKLPRWVNAEQEQRPFDINIDRVVPGTEKNLANYINKGVDPDFITHFHLDRIASDQGEVYGPPRNGIYVAQPRRP